MSEDSHFPRINRLSIACEGLNLHEIAVFGEVICLTFVMVRSLKFHSCYGQ